MPLFNDISSWLKDHDAVFKTIATIAAPGGIWFWIDKFRNRIRIKVRQLGYSQVDTGIYGFSFEAENVSSVLTSFEPEFTLVGYSPERKKLNFTFRFEATDRQLPPHLSKQFLGRHNHEDSRIFLFLWFMKFRFPLNRGRYVTVRVRNAMFEPIGFFRFYWERLLFIWFGMLSEK